jgi:hypothetical protein
MNWSRVSVIAAAALASVWLLQAGMPAPAAAGLGAIAAATGKAGVWIVRHERAVRRLRARAA